MVYLYKVYILLIFYFILCMIDYEEIVLEIPT